MMKLSRFIYLIILTIAPLQAVADEPIKIGIITDLSGPAAYWGAQTVAGAELFKKETTNVVLVYEDSALNTRQGISAAQKLLTLDNVDALYVEFTPISVAVAPIVNSNPRLMVYDAGARSIATKYDFAFKTYLDYVQGCESLAINFKKKGIKQIGFLRAEAEYGELCAIGVKRVIADIYELSYKQGDEVRTQMTQMKKHGVEAIINAGFEGDIVNMLKAAKSLQYPVKIGGSAEDFFGKSVQAQFKDQLEGSLSFGLPRLDQKLIEQLKTLPKGEQLADFQGAGLSYVHLNQIYRALSACPKKELSCITTHFASSNADQRIGFVEWKNRLAIFDLVIEEFKNGKFQLIEISHDSSN